MEPLSTRLRPDAKLKVKRFIAIPTSTNFIIISAYKEGVAHSRKSSNGVQRFFSSSFSADCLERNGCYSQTISATFSHQFLLFPCSRRGDGEAVERSQTIISIVQGGWRLALVWQTSLPLAIGHCPLAMRWQSLARRRRDTMLKEVGRARDVQR